MCGSHNVPCEQCSDNGPCDVPFIYEGMYYDSCITVDNGDVPWCYVNATTKEWRTCTNSSCPYSQGNQ